MKKTQQWSEASVAQSASLYTSISAWKKAYPAAYKAAKRKKADL